MEGLPWVRSPGWHFVSDSNLLCIAAVSLLLLVRTIFHWQTFYPQRKEYRSISSSSCFPYRFSIVYGWLTLSERLLTHHIVIVYVKGLSGGIEQETKMEGILHSQPVDSQATTGSPVSAFLGLWEITSIHC